MQLLSTHRRRFLGQFSVEAVSEALNQRVSSRHHNTAVQTLTHKTKICLRWWFLTSNIWSFHSTNKHDHAEHDCLLTGRMSMSHIPTLVVTTWPTPNIVFPDKPWQWIMRHCDYFQTQHKHFKAFCVMFTDVHGPCAIKWGNAYLGVRGVKKALWYFQPLRPKVTVVAIGQLIVHCGHLGSNPEGRELHSLLFESTWVPFSMKKKD